MSTKKRNIFTKILIWRYKYISERQFILVLSILVGFLAGLGTVLLKYLTLFIQSVLEGGFIKNYYYSLYFIFPIIGVWGKTVKVRILIGKVRGGSAMG